MSRAHFLVEICTPCDFPELYRISHNFARPFDLGTSGFQQKSGSLKPSKIAHVSMPVRKGCGGLRTTMQPEKLRCI